MIRALASAFALAAFALGTGVARAATPARGCSGAVYGQFDFFVGSWVVERRNGKRFATDVVTKEFGGCGIWERWSGDSGSRGAGYSGYVPARGLWVQTFVDNGGDVLVFEGRRSSDGIALAGPSYPKPGLVERNRVVFRPLAGGVVEEYWTTSDDAGKTWTVAFDGFFHRR